MQIYGQASKPNGGSIVRIEKFPARNVLPRKVEVWLPDNYDSTKKYSVLYMNDGQNLFDSTLTWNKQEWKVDESMTALLAANKIRRCIVVAIWNVNQTRTTDYFPAKPLRLLDASLLKNLVDSEFGGNMMGDAYLKFLVTELKPYIDTHFSTLRDQEHTFIAGSSKGALSALYAICEYPGIFGGAACLSTHWVGSTRFPNVQIPQVLLRYLKDNLPSPANHRIYFDYGTEELDSLYEPFQLLADDLMKERGFKKSKNWTTVKCKGETHNERAWRKRFPDAMEFIMNER
ncbi:MAG: alpha/beta hydrolase [Bacteroidetes bacterium]|nr:alpha/beta hydrolase [Bacteroidota bacterium]